MGEGPAVMSSGSRLCLSFSFDRQKFQPAEAQPGDSERLADDGGAWREAPLDLPSGLLEREEEEDDVADCMVAWWVSGGAASRQACPAPQNGLGNSAPCFVPERGDGPRTGGVDARPMKRSARGLARAA
ncbi:MAG: hypothetical protein ABS53_13775 [Hydrogenophaga sp. SCN 70-13]|nr:MAG: hypothetical protein ABS53_13775 [Hydrogenophaga sp. SCN 70-13]OJV55669.1 MAG: hypothetical protein BGO22_09480 [Hydrogenophaga sp. 70-12]